MSYVLAVYLMEIYCDDLFIGLIYFKRLRTEVLQYLLFPQSIEKTPLSPDDFEISLMEIEQEK